ncbi:glycosyltransferase [Oceanihabitans sp.]|nr:glycosyltransferase [Oceanihabitans sp.]
MKNNKTHITFIIPSVAAGGAERILTFVARHIDATKFEHTFIITGCKKDSVYDVEDLNVVYLEKSRVLKAIFPIVRHFRKAKPHIVITSIYHLNTIVAFLSIGFPKIKFIAREASILSKLSEQENDGKIDFSTFFIKKAYQLIDCLVCQSKDMQMDMVTNYGVSIKKTTLINNPITAIYEPKPARDSTNDIMKIVSVGRLSIEKGHDRMIEVLSKLKFPFHYLIIGTGPEKENIFNLIKENGLENQVSHIEYTKEVSSFLKQNDVFLQGSYSDGFPNALVESCVVGTPIIGFKAPGGINEIIEDGENGFIVNSIDECVEKLTQLNADFTFSPKKVNKIVTDRFNSEKIISQYEDLFLKLIN